MSKDRGTFAAEVMAASRLYGVHKIRSRTKEGENCQAALEVKSEKLCIHPPVDKAKRFSAQELTITHASETSVMEGRDRVFYRLLTKFTVQ